MKFIPLSEEQQTEGAKPLRFVPLPEAQQPEGAKPLRFVPLAEQAPPAPVASTVAAPPTKVAPAPAPATTPVAVAQKAEAQASSFTPWDEFKKGVRGGLVGLKSMPNTFGMAGISDVLVATQKRIDILDKIDSGQVKSPREARLLSENDPSVGAYFASDPAMRARIRQGVTNDLVRNKQFLSASMDAFQRYKKEAEQFEGKTEKLTDVRSPTAFGNWLAKSMGEAGVQLAPLMAAAIVTKQPGVLALGTSMEVAGGVQNRMEFLSKELKKLPPEERVNRVAQYLNETNDTTVAAGVMSGSLDALLGPAARAAKLTAKNFLEFSTRKGAMKAAAKQLPKDVGQEFVTGAGQEAIQIGSEKVLGEQKDVATVKNLKRVIDAAAKEAAGAPIGTGVNIARAGIRTPVLAGMTPPGGLFRTEPTAGGEGTTTTAPAAPVTPAAPADTRVEPTLEPTAPTLEAQEKELFDATFNQLVERGIPEDSAARIASRRVSEARKQRIRDLIVKPSQDEIDNRAKELIDGGMDPALAIDEAAKQITAEREADALAESELGGAGDAKPNVPPPVGAGVEVAGQSVEGTPTGGAGVSEPNTVVPAGQTPATDVGGEGTQPGAVEKQGATVSFENNRGVVGNESVLGGLRRISEDDDIASESPNRVGAVLLTGLDRQAGGQAGRASEVVKALTEWADKNNETLVLSPAASGDLKQPELVKWYERNGFTQMPDGAMERQPTQPTDGTQTTETQQAEAPAAGEPAGVAPTPKKRRVAAEGKKLGRPATLTPEQKAENKAKKDAIQAHKARAERAIATAKKILDALEKIDKIEIDALGVDGRAALRTKKRQAIATLLDLQADPFLRGTAVAQRVKEALAHPSITKQEIADIKKGLEVKKAPDQVSRSAVSSAPADARFSKFTNGAQALSHVIKTGNAFQKMLGKRLRAFVNGVKFVVIEQGQAVPSQLQTPRNAKEWDRARALYIEDGITGEKVVYVRGESFGADQGVNNVTVLHELLHAATNRKIALAMDALKRGVSLNDPLVKAAQALLRTMNSAAIAFNDLARAGRLPKGVRPIAVEAGGAALTDPREFLAYGMTDENFQNFLMQARGFEEDTSFFNRFVTGVRKLFGMDEDTTNALSDLILVTDTILSSRAPRVGVFKSTVSPSVIPEDEDEFGNPIRTQKEMDAASQKAKAAVEMSRSFEELTPSMVRKAWLTMTDAARRAWVVTPTFTFLADSSGMTSLKDADKNIQLLNGMANSLMKGAHKILVPLERALNPLISTAATQKLRKQVEDLVLESTIARFDPSDPNNKVFDPRIEQMYKDVGPKGQRLYRMVRDYYADLIDLYADVLDQQILSIQGMSPEAKDNLMLTLRRTFEAEARIRPYFPLVRRGDSWARFNVDDEPVFLMFESNADRRASLEELAKERGTSLDRWIAEGKVSFGEGGIRELRAATQGQSAMLTQIFDALDSEKFSDSEVRESIKDSIYQIYLTTMPEQSFRNQFMRRKDRIGFSTDLIRNIATSASKMSKQLARLKYAPALRNNISAATDTASQDDALSPFVEEAAKRVDKVLKGHEDDALDAVVGFANKVGYWLHLSSAASALVQPASIYISALPILAANHNNATGAVGQLVRALVEVQKYGVITTNADGSTSIEAPSLSNSSRLTPNEQRAVRDMNAYNLAGNTFASLVWGRQGVATDSASTVLGKAGKLGKEAGNLVVSSLMHNVERLTREAVFLASYRMGYKRFQKQKMTPDEAHTAAVEQAVSDVNESLANYDLSNRPRYMQGALGKAVFLFRLFPIHTMLLLGTNFLKMLPLLNKEGKAAAAKKFMGIYLTVGSVAGLAGIPFFGPIVSAIAWVIQKGFEDEDDIPEELRNLDPELWFRDVFLPELTGGVQIGGVPLSEILDTGPLNAITGSAIAERIGLSDLLGRETKEARTSREELQNYSFEKLGVHASTGLSFADAYDAFKLGDYSKAGEKLAPAAIRNPALAYKMRKEGIKDADGNVIKGPDEVSAWKIFMQTIGFRPAEVAKISEDVFKLNSAQQRILNEKKLITGRMKVQIRKGTDEGDDRLLNIIDKEVTAFNRRYPTFAMDGTEIEETLRKDLETRAGSRLGFRQDERNFGLSDKVLTHLEKRIAQEKASRKKE